MVATADGTLGHAAPSLELVSSYEAWADQAFAAGPPELLEALAALAAGRAERMGVATLGRKRGGGRPVAPGSSEARRKAFLQVVVGQTVGCAAGTCLGCAVDGIRWVRCAAAARARSFAADELARAVR